MNVEQTMQAAGYSPTSTGGGCEAWQLKNGAFAIWICSGDQSLSGAPEEKDWLVGLYGQNGEFINSHEAYTLSEALEIAKTFPQYMFQWDDWLAERKDWYRG